ncbi:LysR substrate-binding domain-containing protein [Telmatobacter bradus]|uniref:LysR substrate-binding domain-containing protein n=1 Tax=Telmatobacter bradus TaxID=474953 RepID=UPI003B437EE6
MNLQDLKYFVTAAAERHFGRAAALCHVSQPTLSAQIRKLEEDLGVQLFERTNRKVMLTETGGRMLVHAQRALAEAAALEEVAQSARDPLSGPLKLGVIPTLSPYLMPLLLAPMRREHPRMPLVLREEPTQMLLQALRAHELDAALLATPVEGGELSELRLFDEPLVATLPPRHPLAGQKEIPEAALATELMVLSEGHCLATQALTACSTQMPAMQHGLRAATLETLVQLVAAGYGCTLIPALAVPSLKQRGLVLRPLQGASVRTIRLVSRPGFARPRALRALEKTLLAAVSPALVQITEGLKRG